MPAVSLIKANSYDRPLLQASLESLLAPLGGMSAFGNKGDRVLPARNWFIALQKW
jgi:uncharacterized protein (DUF362 family)